MLGQVHLEKRGTLVLLAATVLVGISIIADGTVAKAFNGVAGVAWFAAAGMLLVAAWKARVGGATLGVVVALTAMVAFVVKPSDILLAVIGFGSMGVLVALFSPAYGSLLARLVVGLYLPLHIGTAVLKAIARSLSGNEASLRTDPPPTAALVPLVMFVAAVGGAELVRYLKQRRHGSALPADEAGASRAAGKS